MPRQESRAGGDATPAAGNRPSVGSNCVLREEAQELRQASRMARQRGVVVSRRNQAVQQRVDAVLARAMAADTRASVIAGWAAGKDA